MGLLDNQTQNDYYRLSTGGFGDYQFTTMENIINGFMAIYVGEGKIISKISRTDVQFHAMRAIQELSYDVFRSVKDQEIEINSTLRMMLPQDYIKYVKIVRVDSKGIERILYPTGKTSNPFPIKQDDSGFYEVDEGLLDSQANLTYTGSSGTEYSGTDQTLTGKFNSDTLKNFQSSDLTDSDTSLVTDATDIEVDYRGRRYGLDPQNAQINGTFFIDQRSGHIFFSSGLAGETVTLKYISDGLGTDAEMTVHKFCEEACYKHIAYGVLSTRSNIPEYLVARFKKEKFAETRKAKIRLSNIKIEEFTQILKGISKHIK